jgi:hypothetical protein
VGFFCYYALTLSCWFLCGIQSYNLASVTGLFLCCVLGHAAHDSGALTHSVKALDISLNVDTELAVAVAKRTNRA